MAQDTVAASRPDISDQRPREEELVLLPDSDGKFQCSHCPKHYGHRCYEPYIHHLEAKHGYNIENIRIKSTHLGSPKPEIKACRNVWCESGTHHVQVNVSQSFGPSSAIKVDEDKIFTVESFFQMHFSRTKLYEDTVKRITEFGRTCCSRPVEATTTVSTAEHPSLHAGADPVQSDWISLVKWLGSCFFPTQRRPNRWNFPAWHRGPDLRRASLHSSEEAIVPDTRHRLNTDINTEVNTYRGSSDLKGDMRHPMCKANLSAPEYAASDDMLPLSQTTPKHTSLVMDAFLPEKITGVVAVRSFHASREGVYGREVVVLTRSDNVSLLERVDFGALIDCERIARQLREIIGESAYDQLSQFQGKQIDIRDPVYRSLLPEGLQIQVGEALPLEQCHPILQARIQSILSV